jgi:hypothetical protein
MTPSSARRAAGIESRRRESVERYEFVLINGTTAPPFGGTCSVPTQIIVDIAQIASILGFDGDPRRIAHQSRTRQSCGHSRRGRRMPVNRARATSIRPDPVRANRWWLTGGVPLLGPDPPGRGHLLLFTQRVSRHCTQHLRHGHDLTCRLGSAWEAVWPIVACWQTPLDARVDIGRGRGAAPDGGAGELHQPHEAGPHARAGKARLRDSNPAPQLCRRIRSPPVWQHGGQTRLMRVGITKQYAGHAALICCDLMDKHEPVALYGDDAN